MKLINHTLLFLSAILFVTVCIWGVLFYYQLLNQVKKTVDDGLANYKIVLIDKLKDDSLIVERADFRENNYIIKQINEDIALKVRDSYKDTLIYSELKSRSYPTRLLSTAFLAANNSYYELKVLSQELDRGNLIREIAMSLLWLFLFLFISTIIVNNFVLKKTWKPFYRLLSFLDKFHLDKGAFYEPVETKIREFALLNDTVRNLVKTNVEIFNSQKQFIENASHELQTPLAIGINKLELLAGEKDLSPHHIEKVGSIIEILQRLTSLNKSLLLLSKIENRQFLDEEYVNFDEIINRITDDFSEYLNYMNISFKYHRHDLWNHKMNPDLARILILNLITNAMFHNRKGGELTITLTFSDLKIENTSNIPELSTDTLFKRFASSHKNNSSTGLGLAIVRAIADVSGLNVTYSFNEMHLFQVSPIIQHHTV